jgi:hypothetical protein
MATVGGPVQMEDGVYHFDNIHSIALTEDGKYVTLYVNAATGLLGLRLPVAEIPTLIGKLFSVASKAAKITGDRTFRSLAIHEIRIIDSPKMEDRAILAVTLDPGAPPLAMDLPKAALVDLARSILQSEGEIPTSRPSSIQ